MTKFVIGVRALGLALAFTLFSTSLVKAADYFVQNKIGRDYFTGDSPVPLDKRVGPFGTVQRALQKAGPGDRIVLLPSGQPYHEEITINGSVNSGTEKSPIVIEGNGVTFDGSVPIDPFAWSTRGDSVAQLNVPFFGKGVLFLDGKLATRNDQSASGEEPKLEPGQYTQWEGKYLYRPEAGKNIRQYPLSVSWLSGGIVVNRASHVIVRNLIVRGYRLDGIQVYGPATGVRFENCEFTENGRAGFCGTNNAKVALNHCGVENNRLVGVKAQLFSKLSLNVVDMDHNGAPSDVEEDSKLAISESKEKRIPPGHSFIPPEYRQLRMRETVKKNEEPKAPEKETESPDATKEGAKKKSFFDE